MWFEVAVVATLFAIGNILFGHFEEGTPKWRRIAKMFLFMALGAFVSARFGRFWFWVMLLVPALVVLFVHAWVLPPKKLPLGSHPSGR